MEKITQTFKGLTGIGGIQLLDIIPTDPATVMDIIKIVTQIAIGIVTIWSMLKKKKK